MKRDSFGSNETESASAGRPLNRFTLTPLPGMEAFHHSLMQHWPGVLFRQRPDLAFEFASPRLEELTGHPLAQWREQPGLFWQVVHELDADEMRQQLHLAGQSAEGVASQFRLRHAATGRVSYVSEFRRAQRDAAGRVTGYEGFWLDVTRQTLAERRLATAAWKETLGLLTVGLAHDFNNVLAGILGLSETFLAQIPANHPFREGLTLVKRNTQQAAHLIERIAQLHRGKTGSRSYEDLNKLVRDGAELLRSVLPKRVELATEPVAAPLPLYVDAFEFQQVLINLALNAAEAMPERGRLTLLTSPHDTLPAMTPHAGTPPRTPAVCLAVADTGHGIKERLLPFLFDPFFTTKPMNRGSGLGLYNARLFAEKHQGAISVETREGQGTTFRLWLPLADFTEAEEAMELSNRRRRTLLLAGHPGQLLDRTAEFLRTHGYQVVVGGQEAEDLLRSGDYPLDGVLLLAEPRDPQPAQLARFVRQQKLPLKVIVKTAGGNPDELDPQLVAKSDLVISADTPEDAILDKLAAAFDLGGSR
jgi:PAS domain S-box-containing protein